jgi:hypothetical protein
MGDIGKIYKLLKLSATGVLALVLGVAQVATGERQGIVSGIGSLLVAAVVFGFIGYVLLPRKERPQPAVEEPSAAEKRSRLLWVGILLSVAPGLLYLYLHYSTDRVDLGAVVFLGIPMLVAGLVCIGASLWPVGSKRLG